MNCQFKRIDEQDNPIEVCNAQGSAITLRDGGIVFLCSKHRSWAPAMGLAARTE